MSVASLDCIIHWLNENISVLHFLYCKLSSTHCSASHSILFIVQCIYWFFDICVPKRNVLFSISISIDSDKWSMIITKVVSRKFFLASIWKANAKKTFTICIEVDNDTYCWFINWWKIIEKFQIILVICVCSLDDIHQTHAPTTEYNWNVFICLNQMR